MIHQGNGMGEGPSAGTNGRTAMATKAALIQAFVEEIGADYLSNSGMRAGKYMLDGNSIVPIDVADDVIVATWWDNNTIAINYDHRWRPAVEDAAIRTGLTVKYWNED